MGILSPGTSAKYLGNKLTNIQDGYQQDAKEKRARFIGRNVELNKEQAATLE